MTTTTKQSQIEALRLQLAAAERRLANARAADVAGGSTTAARASAQRRVNRLHVAIARVEGQ